MIGNSYIKAFGRVFRQTKGIIMGGKSSGWLSDCSLMVDEFKFIDRKVKEGRLELARSFRGLNRYRDDCTALNINDFRQLARDIYPPIGRSGIWVKFQKLIYSCCTLIYAI